MSIDYEKSSLYKVKGQRKKTINKRKEKAIINGYEVDFANETGSYEDIVRKYSKMPINPSYLEQLANEKKN